ncbi:MULTISPECIES: sensor histidine kinase [Streptomyces]|uniref:histidine kinase n=2 Tax=Streptomyces TaxID=1883 RepID=A0A3R7I700_9ACTN|nr:MULTISPECIES: HAMP domain-containing sensor histidine kinase [Streptomyces]KNE79961.1 histidine kinase [Streptomyces fradiae]OFA58152.1 histidine kinase [Streptomyces fradiae]PQM21992.1 HAMP domain-containing histidine kinase [Streptomyces xinghaiensis]RKM95243.1 HAMP domain-containing histidine kinase [Streptomyces xinghaiensis]RNC72828.1 sensor histidine kinase [Streptomyces xinghaiensis]
MRTRLLPLLIVLMAGVLLALGFPLAASQAAAEQQRVVVDRIDDTARFAALAQFVAARPEAEDTGEAGGEGAQADAGGRRAALASRLERYHELYGIRAGVFFRNREAMAVAPAGWKAAADGEGGQAFREALAGRRSHNPPQVWPWQRDRLTIASPVVHEGDVIAVVVTDSPTGQMRSRILRGWLLIGAGESAAMLLAIGAAIRLTGWVLRPVRVLDAVTHDIATGRMHSRVAVSGGPPELRRLARSFNEMADTMEDVLEQQRAFVADASHQLRNPLAALLLRIELLALELPDGNEEIASVRAEGKRLARVLDDLLGLALAEHADPDLQLTDIADLVTERVDSWRPVADREEVGLRYEGPAGATGWADPVALSSALDAVVDNALKFTPGGGDVMVGVEAVGDTVRITVADGGPGLTEEELDRIGDRFWRSNRHQNVSGSGLGLSISRALLAAGGATIGFAPNEPRGLLVTIALPRTAPPERPRPSERRA